ncbi:hypothetical protein [Tepidibacillus marianensis]|uniref:hypothetical protein n=1 Tax=Tepidibacillus marianensis TaxID=3131995 RepID=UPI0030CBF058
MKLNKGKHIGSFAMLPAREGTCPECAVTHEEYLPHNQESLFYQYKFYNEHGRWPTWEDAMSHCNDEVKAKWIKAMKEIGIKRK